MEISAFLKNVKVKHELLIREGENTLLTEQTHRAIINENRKSMISASHETRAGS